MILRPYQQIAKDAILKAWKEGAQDVLTVMPCGAGKTVLFSNILAGEPGYSVVIAHRNELVSQASLTLATNGVRHRIVGQAATLRECSQIQMMELGRNYVDPTARVAVASVDTLIRRPEPWHNRVSLVVTDEAHHLLRDNKWGKALAMFKAARGLGVTATPERADGKGLGREADGVFDTLVVGPSMRDLIEMGNLCDYRIFAPPSDIDMTGVRIGADGDFSRPSLSEAVHRSHIVGDVVAHYLRAAQGKLGITFVVDIEAAEETAAAFRDAGVPAMAVSSKTPALERATILRRFRNREVLQLVNCELFGEGFNLPAIEVASFARPTASYGMYVQQFGRALRPMEGKPHAIILDHVGNVLRHGLPDCRTRWSLAGREKRDRTTPPDVTPTRMCKACLAVYERFRTVCPFCGDKWAPAGRSSPELVEGDLSELDPAVLAALRREIDAVSEENPRIPYGAKPEVAGAIRKRHRAQREAQVALRETMALWGGARTALGRSLPEAQREFWLRYGVDVATAQTLGAKEATELKMRLSNE